VSWEKGRILSNAFYSKVSLTQCVGEFKHCQHWFNRARMLSFMVRKCSEEPLGEREMIEIIQGRLEVMPRMPVPFGDDVSACDLGSGRAAVLKTDMLIDRTDVPKGMSLWQAARKAVVMNVSDFAAKGVQPLALLVSLGLPASVSRKNVEEIADGLNAGAREYGAYVVGGDTGEALDVVISVSVFGVAVKDELMLRSGARPGDVVAVTGFFGRSSAGLKILLGKFDVEPKIRRGLVESVLMPHARLREGLALGKSGAVSASIDSSDGLAWSLHEIARASGVGFLLDVLPVAEEVQEFAKANRLDALGLTLHGGEEYELVVTIKPRLYRKAEEAIAEAGGALMRIGRVTAEKDIVLVTEGKRCVIEPRGYEHFKDIH
jgi:thiamine-monophosphate kinase